MKVLSGYDQHWLNQDNRWTQNSTRDLQKSRTSYRAWYNSTGKVHSCCLHSPELLPWLLKTLGQRLRHRQWVWEDIVSGIEVLCSHAEKKAWKKIVYLVWNTTMFPWMLLIAVDAAKRREDDWTEQKSIWETWKRQSVAEVDIMVCILLSKYSVISLWFFFLIQCDFFIPDTLTELWE